MFIGFTIFIVLSHILTHCILEEINFDRHSDCQLHIIDSLSHANKPIVWNSPFFSWDLQSYEAVCRKKNTLNKKVFLDDNNRHGILLDNHTKNWTDQISWIWHWHEIFGCLWLKSTMKNDFLRFTDCDNKNVTSSILTRFSIQTGFEWQCFLFLDIYRQNTANFTFFDNLNKRPMATKKRILY